MARKNEKSPAEAETKKTPKQPGRFKQMLQVFHMTRKVDRTLVPYMALAMVGSIVAAVLLSWWLLSSPWYGVFLGVAIGLLAAMFILARKAEAAAFDRIRGQQGAPLAAMQSIRRGWNVEDEPVQIDPRSQTMLFRAYGRAGIALVAENGSNISLKLLEKERRSIRRVLNHENVPVHQIIVGDGEGEVPLHKLPGYMTRMKKVLTRDESAEVAKRLAALKRSLRMSVPKGVDPMRARPNRKALRGR
ncbi:DUF4191 domain-containing protein [Brachybacterium hainanense]|uniref:DUF4191 domain-containing protein n=1 Tax=Brachybacterium hainanense TaxID=1541174 RepID=A0ABV6RBA7_9MICO